MVQNTFSPKSHKGQSGAEYIQSKVPQGSEWCRVHSVQSPTDVRVVQSTFSPKSHKGQSGAEYIQSKVPLRSEWCRVH